MVSIFTDLKKAQIYKMPYRNSPHPEIEMVTKFDYQHLFKPFDLDKKTHGGIVNDEKFLLKIDYKKYIFLGEKVYNFETIDDIDEYFSETGNNDSKYPFALSKENIYYMAHQKYIASEEFENSKMFDKNQYLYKKDSELKSYNDIEDEEDIVEYGNDFLFCKSTESKQILTNSHTCTCNYINVFVFQYCIFTFSKSWLYSNKL